MSGFHSQVILMLLSPLVLRPKLLWQVAKDFAANLGP